MCWHRAASRNGSDAAGDNFATQAVSRQAYNSSRGSPASRFGSRAFSASKRAMAAAKRSFTQAIF
jgi:hypothetical protein